jgi:Fe(3+) dicitrate transport protein
MPGGLTTAQYAADPSRARAATTSSPAAAPTARSSTPTRTAATTSKCWLLRGLLPRQLYRAGKRQPAPPDRSPPQLQLLGVEPRYSRIFETGSVVQEVSVGYRYLKEKSSETALRTAYYAGHRRRCHGPALNTTRPARAAPRPCLLYRQPHRCGQLDHHARRALRAHPLLQQREKLGAGGVVTSAIYPNPRPTNGCPRCPCSTA